MSNSDQTPEELLASIRAARQLRPAPAGVTTQTWEQIRQVFEPVFYAIDVLYRAGVHIPGKDAMPTRIPPASVFQEQLAHARDQYHPIIEIVLNHTTKLQLLVTSFSHPLIEGRLVDGDTELQRHHAGGGATRESNATGIVRWMIQIIGEYEVNHNPQNILHRRPGPAASRNQAVTPAVPPVQLRLRPGRVINLDDSSSNH